MLVGLALAGGLGAATLMTLPARGGQSISNLLAEVNASFGDNRLLSASDDGSTLIVRVAAPDSASAVSATFEAQMLGYAASSDNQGQISSVQYTDVNGVSINGYSRVLVAPPSIPALATGACDAAAQALLSAFADNAPSVSLSAEAVRTTPYGGGSCAFKFETDDPEAFAVNAPAVVGPLDQAMGSPGQRAFLLEVDDKSGSPQFVYSWSPSFGGVTYVKPGLSLAFVGGVTAPPKHSTGPTGQSGPTGASGSSTR
jgi:hypothetical protein